MGFRVGFGRDYDTYEFVYNLPKGTYQYPGFEPIWMYLYEFLKFCGLKSRSFFLVTSGFIIWGVYKGTQKYGVNIWLATIVFILSGIYYETSNTVRQCVAQVLIFMSIPYFKNCNTFNGIILCLLAVCFHYSALVAILMLIISQYKYNKLFLFALVVLCCFTGQYIIDIVLNKVVPNLAVIKKFQYDVSDFDDGVSSGLLKYIYLSLAILFISYRDRMIKINPVFSNSIINLFILSICTYCVFYSFQPARRLFAYGFMFIIPVFPIFLRTQSKLSAKIIGILYLIIFLLFQTKLCIGTEYDFDVALF